VDQRDDSVTRFDFEKLSALLKSAVGRLKAILISEECFVIIQRFIFDGVITGPLQLRRSCLLLIWRDGGESRVRIRESSG
jgi:hypothetical protein